MTSSAPPLFRQRSFRNLYVAGAVSQFGSQIGYVAMPLLAVTVLAAGPGEVALLSALGTLTVLVLGLPAGVWVDRLRRRPLMIAADVLRALVLLSVPVAWWWGWLGMGQLYAVAVLVGSGTLVFDLAAVSLLPGLVGRERLTSANSLLVSTWAGMDVAGRSVAGVLVQVAGAPLALLLDALSYLWSATWLRRVPDPSPPAAPSLASPADLPATRPLTPRATLPAALPLTPRATSPVTTPAGPSRTPPAGPPVTPSLTPPAGPPVTPSLTPPAGPPVTPSLTPPAGPPVTPGAASPIGDADAPVGPLRSGDARDGGEPDEATRGGTGRQIAEGVRFLLGNQVLVGMTVMGAMANLAFPLCSVLLPVLIVDELDLPEWVLGGYLAVGGLGTLAGAATAHLIGRRLGTGRATLLVSLVTAPPSLVIPFLDRGWWLWAAAAAWFVLTFRTGVNNVLLVSVRQRITPDRMLGRTNATMRLLLTGAVGLGGLLAGLLGEVWGVRASLWAGAVIMASSWLPVLLSPLRREP
ncbi:MFS family permease [Nonomuraea muscovyensis]|uniref:MFS family permease n=1 Tax=Nonomuraea muscovyensis TaxID=1124761 RepID=A0A7X0C8U8_9ACTN|nr:MFS transporter [Nonomuraea muscovyensis]MBB6350695.1 MFS family permease [Nonomuraea muscovyensis]